MTAGPPSPRCSTPRPLSRLDNSGRLFIADSLNQRVRMIDNSAAAHHHHGRRQRRARRLRRRWASHGGLVQRPQRRRRRPAWTDAVHQLGLRRAGAHRVVRGSDADLTATPIPPTPTRTPPTITATSTRTKTPIPQNWAIHGAVTYYSNQQVGALGRCPPHRFVQRHRADQRPGPVLGQPPAGDLERRAGEDRRLRHRGELARRRPRPASARRAAALHRPAAPRLRRHRRRHHQHPRRGVHPAVQRRPHRPAAGRHGCAARIGSSTRSRRRRRTRRSSRRR